MLDPADTEFFRLLKEACATLDTLDPDCRAAIDRAVATGDPADLRAARIAVDALDAETRDGLLRQVHQRMATDLSGILNALPTARARQRPN